MDGRVVRGEMEGVTSKTCGGLGSVCRGVGFYTGGFFLQRMQAQRGGLQAFGGVCGGLCEAHRPGPQVKTL